MSNYELILMCLKEQEWLPYELIQILMRLYYRVKSEPVLLFVDSKTCRHCPKVRNMWFSSPIGLAPKEESLLYDATQMWTGLRYCYIQLKDFNDTHAYDRYPEFIPKIVKWYPNISLVPGAIWDGFNKNISGIKIMNGKITENSEINLIRHMINIKKIILDG